MSEPPAKVKALKKLPPKTVRRDKITQAVDPTKVYTLNTEGKKRGTKIVLYAASGMGKTTLGTLAPDPVFVAADDGVDEILHPVTGEVVPNYRAETYQDVRNILGQPKLFDGFKTIVLDNMTEVENLAIPHILNTVTRDGKTVKSLEGYGWGAGYQFLAEHDAYVKYDLQRLCDLGLNIVVICQKAPRKETSAEVEEYLKDGPKLVWRPGSKAFAVTDLVEWADHCFKIDYTTKTVNKKRVTASTERAVFIQPEPTYEAKARGIPATFEMVSFESPQDDSIWQFVFEQAWKNIETEEESA